MTNLARRRLQTQGLVHPRLASPVEVVSWLGAVQAQDYPAALWALGLRLPGSTARQVEEPVQSRALIRTWLMRGTLHFVAPDDLGWMLSLFAEQQIKASARRYRELNLDEPTLARSSALIHQALSERQPLTRRALFVLLDEHGLHTPNQRGIYMLARASYEGLIAQGVEHGRDPAFFLLEDNHPKLDRQDAIAELARRYFIGHGPATLDDFVWWSGLRVAEARSGLEAVKRELVSESLDSGTYWSSAESASGESAPVNAHLLPAYDEFLIGYKDRSASLNPEWSPRVRNANGLGATIAYEGQVIGTWTRETKRSAVAIHAEPFSPWSAAVTEAVEQAVARFGTFLEKPASLHVSI